jgi:hypothetical protein
MNPVLSTQGMTAMIRLLSAAFLALLLLGTFTRPAHAYLDPGTISMALQAILGAIAAGFVAIKMFWSRILGFFGKGKPAPTPEASKPESE